MKERNECSYKRQMCSDGQNRANHVYMETHMENDLQIFRRGYLM